MSIEIIVGAFSLLATAGGIVAYTTRKIDKVKFLSEKIPSLDDIVKRVDVLEARVDQHEHKIKLVFSKTDIQDNATSILEQRMHDSFDEVKYTQSLMLEGLSALIEATPDIRNNESVVRFREKLSTETMIVTRRRDSV